MGYLVADQNKLCHFFESGLYANTSGAGQWIGKVLEHSLDENLNITENRYLSTSTRNVDEFLNGVKHFEGNITYRPQDFKMWMFALGSNVDGGSPSPYTHVISETNSNVGNAFTSGTFCPFIAFGLEDAQVQCSTGNNFVRTVKGCTVDSLSLKATQGEPVESELSYMAQSVDFSSGAATAVTDSGLRPFMFNDVTFQFASGTTAPGVTEINFSIKNNLKREDFLNGSTVSFGFVPLNRDYELSLVVEGEGVNTKSLYDQYFIGGSTFNGLLCVNVSAGSRDAYFSLSGCRIMDMEAPTANEGVNQQTITIKPKSCSISVNDFTMKYGAW
jgi:hypothetical protein